MRFAAGNGEVRSMMTSLYTATTGLKTHGVGMSTVSSNIANVNTVGFKKSMMLYSENMSTAVNSASGSSQGLAQLGLGVSVGVNRTMFQDGGFEAGNTATDLAISGKGFFGVEKGGEVQYTRAGNFRFTKDGELIDPNGFQLLGNRVTNGVVSATAEPIAIDFSRKGQGYMQPKATSTLTMIENLGSREAGTTDEDNPFFSLAAAWNGVSSPPLSSQQYGSLSQAGVYDASGQAQNLNTYYDYVGSFDGKHVYQYVMGVDPSVDGSVLAGTGDSGLVAAGTVTFSAGGTILDMTMFVPGEGDLDDPASWVPASFDASGNPMLTATFLDAEGNALPAQTISLNLGLEMNGTWTNEYATAADVNADPAGLYTGPGRKAASQSSTSFAGTSGTLNSHQDGYAPGSLQDMTISTDGYMIGKYSNGQTDELFRIPIYRFMNEEGLRHEGGNRYTANNDSGAAEAGFPSTENFGSLHESTLEQSNVDLASEFTTMIMTQRGFQLNSKAVTTADTMLQRALELKR